MVLQKDYSNESKNSLCPFLSMAGGDRMCMGSGCAVWSPYDSSAMHGRCGFGQATQILIDSDVPLKKGGGQ